MGCTTRELEESQASPHHWYSDYQLSSRKPDSLKHKDILCIRKHHNQTVKPDAGGLQMERG